MILSLFSIYCLDDVLNGSWVFFLSAVGVEETEKDHADYRLQQYKKFTTENPV